MHDLIAAGYLTNTMTREGLVACVMLCCVAMLAMALTPSFTHDSVYMTSCP